MSTPIKNKPFRLTLGFSLISLLYLSNTYAEPVTLDDLTLNQVTAGSESNSSPGGSGGAIIGNSSEATINQTGGVDLSGEVQSGAKGLNIVNSAESTVANGVNVWDVNSNGVDSVEDSGEMGVVQSNVINQEQRRSASMPNYSRPDANTFIEIVNHGSESHNDNFNRNNNIVDTHTLTSDAHNTSTASVTTTIEAGVPDAHIDTNVGKGLAIAGELDAFIDGGEVQVGLAVGGSVIAQPDRITPTTEPRPNESFGGMTVGDENSDFTLYGRLILPEIELHINGSGCGVAMGSCDAGGTSDLNTSDEIDNSVLDNEMSSSVGSSEYTNDITETYRSPFDLNDAQAEYIVVDDSSLAVNTTFTLSLSGSAQSAVNAMNVVNATGSAVADGINIARTSGLSAGGSMNLQQTNMISHSR